jgi:hypothetical protein
MMAKFEAGISEGWMQAFVVDPETGDEIKDVAWVNEEYGQLKQYTEDCPFGYVYERDFLLVHEA